MGSTKSQLHAWTMTKRTTRKRQSAWMWTADEMLYILRERISTRNREIACMCQNTVQMLRIEEEFERKPTGRFYTNTRSNKPREGTPDVLLTFPALIHICICRYFRHIGIPIVYTIASFINMNMKILHCILFTYKCLSYTYILIGTRNLEPNFNYYI